MFSRESNCYLILQALVARGRNGVTTSEFEDGCSLWPADVRMGAGYRSRIVQLREWLHASLAGVSSSANARAITCTRCHGADGRPNAIWCIEPEFLAAANLLLEVAK